MNARPPTPALVPAERVHLAFVFTDIEGSTRLLERLEGAYGEVLATHAGIVRAGIAAHRGREVDTQGDAFFVVFPRTPDAVRFAAGLQAALAAHPWPEGVTVRLRIGIHAGQATPTRTGFVGMDVHHGARVAAAAHGGQVLATREVADELTDDAAAPALRSLGEFSLKDIRGTVELLQLGIPGLPDDFPPPRTLDEVDEPPAEGEPPYPGLVPFEETDAARFFGREALVKALVARLDAAPFLAIVGASGSGKSSLVRAGLIPALRRADPHRAIALLTPTEHPLDALEQASPDGAPWALVIDQAEELFTLCRDDAERDAFIDRALGLLDAGSRVVVVLRADFYDRLAAFDRLRTLAAEHQAYLGPLGPTDLRAAIEGPAGQGGWRLAPGLADLIIHDVGTEPGALPLLSHALRETWDRRRGTLLTLRGYLDSGGVQGAIARTADRLVATLDGPELERARSILLRLTELGAETPDTRRRARLDELAPEGADDAPTMRILDRLVAARLVVADDRTAEVAHEALIREWPLLREWLDEDRDALRLHRAVTEAAAEWERAGDDPSLLFRGSRLVAATDWLRAHTDDANTPERRFLVASTQAVEAETAEREAARQRELDAANRAADAERARADTQTRSARRIRRAAGALVGLLVVAVALAGFAFVQTQQADRSAAEARDQATVADVERAEAEEQSRVALGRQLVAQSLASRDEPDRSLLLALEGVDRDVSGESLENLASVLGEAGEVVTRRFPVGGAGALAASPDGRSVAVVSSNGEEDQNQLRIHRTDDWSVIHGPIPASVNHSFLSGNGPYGENMVFDRAGGRLVFPTPDELGILDLASGQVTKVPGTPGIGLDSVAWRRLDGRLAWISRDDFAGHPVVRILDEDGTTVHSATLIPGIEVGEDSYPYPGYLSPDGGWAITSDGTHAQLFRADTGDALAMFPDGETRILGFAPDGTAVVMLGPDGAVVRTLPGLEQVGVPIGVPPGVFAAEPDVEAGLLRVWTDGRSMMTHDLTYGSELDPGSATAGSVVKLAVADRLRFVARQRSLDTVIEVVDSERASPLQVGPATPLDPEVGIGDGDPESLMSPKTVISADGSAVAHFSRPEDGPTRSLLVGDIHGAALVEVRPDEASGIADVALTPDGRAVITLHDSGRIIRTDWAQRVSRDVGVFAPPDPDMSALVDGPDGLLAQMGERIRLFTPDGDRYLDIQGWDGQFLPDGSALIVSDCDLGVVRSIDMTTEAVAWERFVGGCPWDLDVSPDGQRLLVGDIDSDLLQQLSLVDGASLGIVRLPSRLDSPRYEDATDGRTIVGEAEGSLLHYDVDPSSWQRLACAAAGRNLSRAEWSRAVPGSDYHVTCPEYADTDQPTVPVASLVPSSTPAAASVAPSALPASSLQPGSSPTVAAGGLCRTYSSMCWQPPGRVTLTVEPRVSVDMDGSWYLLGFEEDRMPDALTLAHDKGRTVDLIFGLTDLLDADGTAVSIAAGPQGFVDGLRADERLTVSEPTDTTLFGQPAISVDVTTGSDAELFVLPVSGTTYYIPATHRIRFIAATLDGTLAMVAVETRDADLDAFWESDAKAMIDTMRAEPEAP